MHKFAESMHECRYQIRSSLSHTPLYSSTLHAPSLTKRCYQLVHTHTHTPSPQELAPHSAEADKAQCVFPPSTAILFKDKCVTAARCFMGCAKWFQWPVPGG